MLLKVVELPLFVIRKLQLKRFSQFCARLIKNNQRPDRKAECDKQNTTFFHLTTFCCALSVCGGSGIFYLALVALLRNTPPASSRMTNQCTLAEEEGGGETGWELTSIPVFRFTITVISVMLIKKVSWLSLTKQSSPLVHMPIQRSQGFLVLPCLWQIPDRRALSPGPQTKPENPTDLLAHPPWSE